MTTKVRPNTQSAIDLLKWPLLVAAAVFILTWMALLGFHLVELLTPQIASAQVEVEPPTFPASLTVEVTVSPTSGATAETTPEPTPLPATPTPIPAHPRPRS